MTRDAPRSYVIAYDIAHDARRLRVAHVLGGYGDRLQYSVFLLQARPAKLVRLQDRLSRLIDPSVDSILVCDLGLAAGDPATRLSFIGRGRPWTESGPLIL
jgi:CRISPR-associated protein Cas2